ncbi:DUF4926 domain-containing protein [Pannus brasiliensis CCIBt3594]|uniref:DUF4926 domain-containing protein n=1 Tax=Pannus brasiliensis CCIBt3594 TaxID=1427578 RepID=A0AAW9QZP0_9CHRO
MSYVFWSDVILQHDIPEEGLFAGDVGMVVEKHQLEGLEIGYSIEFSNMLGESIAVVTLPESSLRLPTGSDRRSARPVSGAIV